MDCNAIINIVQSLELSMLDSEWVEQMYASEFTEKPNIDLDLPSATVQLLVCLNEELRKESGTGDSSVIWNEMGQNGIDQKVIKAWIYYLFSEGLKMSSGFKEKLLCVLAANFYFLLLKMPGMFRTELYHAILFEKAVDSFHMAANIKIEGQENGHSRKRKADIPSSQSQKRRRQGSDSLVQDDDDNANMNVEITEEEMNLVYKQLMLALKDFCKYLSTVSMRSNEVSVKHTIQILAKMANTLKTNSPSSLIPLDSFKSDGSTADSLPLPYQLTLYGLFLIISKKHGELDELSLLLFTFLLPILIMKEAHVPSSTIPQAFMKISEMFCKFVCTLYDIHGDVISHSISVLTQNIIAQSPDRAEFRNHMPTIVTCIMHHMHLSWYMRFCEWLQRMSVHSKIIYRSNTLSVIGRLLCLPERRETGNTDQPIEDEANKQHGLFVKIAVGRLKDVAPSVRSRALTVLIDMMEQAMVSPSALLQAMDSVCPSTVISSNFTPSNLHTDAAPSTTSAPAFCNQSILLDLLTKCASEPKAMVRKTAIHALEMALKTGFLTPSKSSLEVLEMRCRDPSLVVRKQTITSITEVLLHHKDCSDAQESWAKGVFPAILDPESSMQEKAATVIESVIVNNISDSHAKSELAWSLIQFFATESGQKLRIHFQTVCRQWNRSMKLDANLLNKVISKLEDERRSSAAWMFTRYLTLYTSTTKTASKIVEVWMSEHSKEQTLIFHINSIVTLGRICQDFDAETREEVKILCIQKLKNAQYPIQLISHLVETICNIIEASHKKNPEGKQWPQPLMDWCQSVLKECDTHLFHVVRNHSNSEQFQEKSLIHFLHVAGEVGKHCAMKVPKRLQLCMQALLTSTDCLDNMLQMSQAPTQQLTLSQEIPQSQPLSQFHSAGGVPQHIRAHAIINLGKICLHNPILAKKCIPAIVRELDTCESDMVRNNALIILTDLCMQQTQLVDQYIADMANCLGDQSIQVRRSTLILLNSLLKKDYVKWRGSLIFKFLSRLCDKDSEIRDLVRFSLIEQTLRRNAGDTFFRHFVESMFYFNNYREHATYNCFVKSDRESRFFDFSGESRAADRMQIYIFMLAHMDDEHRVNLTAKLCSEILEAVVDEIIPLSNKSSNILADALGVLCCQEIKLKCLRHGNEDDSLVEEMQNDPAAAVKNAMKQKIISNIVKRNLVENIIPVIIALKNLLVSKKHPLVKNVMLYLKEVMKDYKTEVHEVLAVDKQLATEIEFDLKRFEREEEERSQENIPPVGLPAPGTPSRLPLANNLQTASPSNQLGTSNIMRTPARGAQETPPRTPNAVSNPGVPIIGTPPRTPGAVFASPGPVLQRKKGLGITAMLNSVRKSTAKLKLSDKENEDVVKPGSEQEGVKRATSTPTKISALDDLTFSNFTEISMILEPPVQTEK